MSLKWTTESVVIAVAGTEVTRDIIGYQAGKNRKIKFIAGSLTAGLDIVAYRTSEQVVKVPADLLTASAPLLPVDITLKEGDVFKLGYKDVSAGAATYNIMVGYEETD